ncbi:hypothetical protein R6Q57_020500 [Mikania cordata]
MTASHSTPVVVNAKVDGHDLHRIYRVGGSVVELMYEHCFIQLDKYNIIMGRPGISTFGAIVSIAHAMIKFPTKAGVCTILSKIARL